MGYSENIAAHDYAAEQDIADEAISWASFAAARLASEFCQSWLRLQCRMVSGSLAGLLLLETEDGSFAPAATWAIEGRDVAELVPTAERALRERRGLVERTGDGDAHAAYPVDIHGKLWGVVVVNLGASPEGVLQGALRRLHWGAGWLETLFHRRQAEQDAQKLAAARLALEIVGAVAPSKGLVGAATALANELATRVDCCRVAIGAVRRGRVRVLALSHSASLAKKLRLADSLANAMEEAVDQSASVGYPPVTGGERRVAIAHRDHVRDMRLSAVLSVVLSRDGQTIGVIALERDAALPFDSQTLALCEAVASLVGPVIGLQQELDRPLTGRAVRALTTVGHAVLGRGNPAVKLAAGAVAVLAIWLSVATDDFRVSDKATIEGELQMALVAPFNGFIATASKRAGDLVEEGEVLATLDARELRLEALRYDSEREEARLKQKKAEDKRDRAEAAVQNAYAAEADAQFELASSKLNHAQAIAPFRGLIVSGDLTHDLGSPVERGKILFQVAPLNSYRVVVKVDERDISYIRAQQVGHLVLNGLAAATLDFDVERIVPVADAGQGRNTFDVEGKLRDGSDPRLRPGMEGIGKITVGRARLIWIWAHPIIDWARLLLWKWLP
jgi:Barrel-sandwich domain of CusB or HlyD membrane-fusion